MNAKFKPIALQGIGLIDLGGKLLDMEIRQAVTDCIEAQRQAGAQALSRFTPDPQALEKVSPGALKALLDNNQDIHGLASDRDLSNGICFNAGHIADAVMDAEVDRTRRIVDRLVSERINTLFRTWKDLAVVSSGLFWYPPGCAMGWHTNSRAPGWRIYINYADEKGKSFFRYRHPQTRELITLEDKHWNFRAFHVTGNDPLWHCIYSNTNRFSFGYRIMEPSFKGAVLKKVKKLVNKPADQQIELAAD